jgi:hypothetical protein
MKFFGILFLLMVIFVVVSLLPILNVETPPLAPGVLLGYDRVGGIAGYNQHLTINESGTVIINGSVRGTVPDDKMDDLTRNLDGNRYYALRESFYDRLKRQHEKPYPDSMYTATTVRSISGVIRINPDKLINDLIRSYLSY